MADRIRLPSYAIESYSIDALPAALALAKEVLGDGRAAPKTEAFWRWKHHDNPFGQSGGLYAWDTERQRAIGLRIMMRWTLEGRDGERIPAARAVDTATHPAYRRQGIFSALTRQTLAELTEQGVSFVFNTPNRETSLPGYLKLGWRVVAQWPLYVRVLRPGRMAVGLLGRGRDGGDAPQFDEVFGPGILRWEAFEERYGPELEGLLVSWEGGRAQSGLRTPRNTTYLRWRYGGHPHLHYGLYPLEQGGELAGLAIVRPNLRRGLREAVLAELFLRSADARMGKELLNGLLRQLKGDYVIAHFSEGTLERNSLRNTRFLRLPGQGILFTAYALDRPPLDPLVCENWDLSLGDLEIF